MSESNPFVPDPRRRWPRARKGAQPEHAGLPPTRQVGALVAVLGLVLAGGCAPLPRSQLPQAEAPPAIGLDHDRVSATETMVVPKPPPAPKELKVKKRAIRHGGRAARPVIESPEPRPPAAREGNRLDGDARFIRGRLDALDATTRSLSDPRGAWPASKAETRPGSSSADEAGRLRLELDRRALEDRARDLEWQQQRLGSGQAATPLEQQIERLRQGPRW